MRTITKVMISLATLLLILVVILSAYNTPFFWVYITVCCGQLFFICMVYYILTDKRTSTKTFDDWYEDHTINDIE
ncbi:hypothetical protein [Aquimarina sp. 2-A2]|uniref:hypothetical protein n=1 Tax=Aquimarina sp. 2-A2 TaxID=3382644 RepID=UPI003890C2BA